MISLQKIIPVQMDQIKAAFPGLLIATLIAISAKFLSEHYGAPAMLLALLLGIALHFLSEEGKCVSGIKFAASPLLRIGVALLGARHVAITSYPSAKYCLVYSSPIPRLAPVTNTTAIGWL